MIVQASVKISGAVMAATLAGGDVFKFRSEPNEFLIAISYCSRDVKGYGTSGHMSLVALRSFFSIIKTCQRNLVPLLASYSLKEAKNVFTFSSDNFDNSWALSTDSVLNHVSKGVYK